MTHAIARIYIHFVWTTKGHAPLLRDHIREKIREHIAIYATQNSIKVEAMAVRPEHVHFLVSLSRSQRIEDVVKLIKGESSHWINQGGLVPGRFSWQRGYWGESVSCNAIQSVRSYIANQDEHHRIKSFREEYESMLVQSGFSDAEISAMLSDGNR